MNEEIKFSDLPDLSDWRYAPIWTLEQASLIWGGIDPAFFDYSMAREQVHPKQFRRTAIALQAFLGGISLRTLQPYELYLFDYHSYGHESYEVDPSQSFSSEAVDIKRTTIMQSALIEWTKKQGYPSLRASLRASENKQNTSVTTEIITVKSHSKPLVKIEQIDYIPKHKNPSYEVLTRISKDVWDKLEDGAKPPKQPVVIDEIKRVYREVTGDELTSKNIVSQIDAIARPPKFK